MDEILRQRIINILDEVEDIVCTIQEKNLGNEQEVLDFMDKLNALSVQF